MILIHPTSLNVAQRLRPATAGLITGYRIAGFTLIELMAATTVLSIILLMMVGMQDQMSKAWSNANRRTDATREARAAVSLMAADLTCPIFRARTNSSSKDEFAYSVLNKGLPFVYSSNGTGSGLTITNIQPGSSCLFFVAPTKTSGTGSSDLALIGYFVGQTNGTSINGFTNTNYNLYRYYVPNSAAPLASWFSNAIIGNLFSNVPANSEMLARNVANLQILFYNEGQPIVQGANYTNNTSGTRYRGNKLQIALTLYPEEIAQKFTALQNWTNSGNIRRYARSFELRVDCPRD
jgi:prepilin-type N-terminal cleavage/methylation domain-containing protein